MNSVKLGPARPFDLTSQGLDGADNRFSRCTSSKSPQAIVGLWTWRSKNPPVDGLRETPDAGGPWGGGQPSVLRNQSDGPCGTLDL